MATSVEPTAAAAPAPTASPIERNFNATIAKVAGNTGIPADPVVETPQVTFVKDAPPATEPAAPVESAAPDAPTADAETPVDAAAPVVAEPTGEVVVDDEITLRAERNADGTYKSKLDPTQKMDLEFKDKETGEIRKYSKTLPEVLRLAKDGIALQQKQAKVQPELDYYRTNVPKWQEAAQQTESTVATLKQQYEDMAALNRELLTAPDEVVIRHREHYASENTPQKLAERERAKLEQERAELAVAHRQARAQSFIETRLASPINAAKAVLGDEVVTGMLASFTVPLVGRDGQIPPERWPDLEQYVTGPLTEAATKKKAELDKAKADSSAEAERLRKAQAAAQKAVNETRTQVPVGSAAPDRAPQLPKPKNTKEALDRLINRPLPTSVQPTL